MTTEHNKKMSDKALYLAKTFGLCVFPVWSTNGEVCACGRPECRSQGKHPINKGWQENATSDPSTIESFWRKNPDANIGVLTGKKNGLCVIDIDPRHGGDQSLLDLGLTDEERSAALEVATGGGGLHFYYAAPTDTQIGCPTSVLPGIDVRCEGGFVVGPDSIHVSGSSYKILQGGKNKDLSPLPDKFRKLILNRRGRDSVTLKKESIPEGDRNNSLFLHACRMHRAGASDRKVLESTKELNQKSCRPPLSTEEVNKILSSAASYRNNDGDALRSSLTDIGNARRFARLANGKAVFVSEEKKWYVFDGNRWARDTQYSVQQIAREVISEIQVEAASATGSSASDLIKHAKASSSEARIKAMINLARSEIVDEKPLTVSMNNFDINLWLLNCANGTVDLRTGEIKEPAPQDLITKLVPIPYHPDMACDLWRKTLEQVVPDKETREFLQRFIGYALTGSIKEQVMVIAYGTGANGKTTVFETIRMVLGDYASQTPSETLLVRRSESIPNDIARLKGMRMVLASEIEQGKRFAESRIKQLTGGDSVSARFLYGEWFDFIPVCKIILLTNHKPQVEGNSNGIWRRIHLVPFGQSFPVGDPRHDPDLMEKLKKESAGILSWAVEGASEWFTNGLNAPKVVQKATSEYRSEEDGMEAFIKDECERGDPQITGVYSKDLYDCYVKWCEKNGEQILAQRSFGQGLKEKNFTPLRVKGNRAWRGLKLIPDNL